MASKKKHQGYTQAGLARKIGINRSNVSRAVANGRLVLNDDGRIDTEDKANQAFLRFHKTAVKAQGDGGKGRPIATEDPDEVVGNSVEQGRSLDNQLKRVKLQRARIDYLEAAKQLIPVEIVSRHISNIAVLFNENIRSFDERFGAELFEVAKEGSESKFIRHLAKLLNKSMEAVMNGAEKELRAMDPLKEPPPVKVKESPKKKPAKKKIAKKKPTRK